MRIYFYIHIYICIYIYDPNFCTCRFADSSTLIPTSFQFAMTHPIRFDPAWGRAIAQLSCQALTLIQLPRLHPKDVTILQRFFAATELALALLLRPMFVEAW